MGDGVYHRFGCRPAINACGVYTDLGGSRLAPRVWAAMEESNRAYSSMPDLLDATGLAIAQLLGTEDARITPGASSAITLATAACMAGTDGPRAEQLPDPAGMKADVLIQRRHRNKYDRMVRIAGARLVEVGDELGTTREQMEAAISASTAAVFFPAHLGGVDGTVPLADVVELAHSRSVPVIVDAAYMNYPVELMRSYTDCGADLAIFSAKYFSGPNCGGLMCGRADLIRAVASVDFTRYESGSYLPLGRPFKQDRQLVIGVMMALEEWLGMDHAARFAEYARFAAIIAHAVEGLRGITSTPMHLTMAEDLIPEPVNCLWIEFGPEAPRTPAEVGELLLAGDPAIYVHVRDRGLVVDVECVAEDEARAISERLCAVLS